MEEEQQEEMEGWMESYRQAVQFDKWGQVVEAVEVSFFNPNRGGRQPSLSAFKKKVERISPPHP